MSRHRCSSLVGSHSALATLPPRYSETTAIVTVANLPAMGAKKGGNVQETGNPDKAKDLTQFPALRNMHTFCCVKAPLNPGPHLSVSTLKIKERNCEVMCLGLAWPAKIPSDYQTIA